MGTWNKELQLLFC